MKKNTIRLFALMAALALVVFSFASCKKEEPETTTEAASTTLGETTTEAATGDTTVAPSDGTATTVGSASTTAPPTADPFALNSSDATAVLALYKKAINADVNKGFENVQKIAFVEKISGSGVASILSVAQPIFDNIISKNETTNTTPPGDIEKLSVQDISSATAASDAQYTTITLKIKEQTDGINGKAKEGSVGRSIGVLDGIDGLLKDLEQNSIKVDASAGKIELKYTTGTVMLKIEKTTGKIVEGNWKHITNVTIDNVKAKVSFLPNVSLNNVKAVLSYEIKTK
ncbi:MAG: hypothetical protein LBS36_00145 [Oscillospiraceae bacterium]|jgi:hypothetical protein|nr:hypothetical protein [Oscillospiraceae bacterium]